MIETVSDEGSQAKGDDEISLVDLLATVLKYKKMIILVTIGAILLSLLYALGSHPSSSG